MDSVLDRVLGTVRLTTCLLDIVPIVPGEGGGIWDSLRGIINLSLSSRTFAEGLKEVVVAPLLKKPLLDPSNVANYHPVLNLSLLGKLTKRVVAE